jgi:3-deoxy-D-manno-octulosonic-acid transferase
VTATLFRALYAIAGRTYGGWWRAGWVRPGGNSWHPERGGEHPPRDDHPLWLHAASLGEVTVAAAYAPALRPIAPLYLTVQTESGHDAARRHPVDWNVTYAPLDTTAAVRRFLTRVSPRGLVLFETELWPAWLRTFTGPVWIGNGKLSARSLRRWTRFRSLLQPGLDRIRFVGAQSAGDRRRFASLGIPDARVVVTGQIKQFGTQPAVDRELRRRWRTRLRLAEDRRLWVCGSVRPDEVDLVLSLFGCARAGGAGVALVLAPRHLDHVATTLARAKAAGFVSSTVSEANGRTELPDILVLDTHGELASLYAAADLALLGGTFAPHGGHNPNEPARYGVPVVTGPFTAHIEGDLALLAEAELAYRLENPGDLPALAASLRDFDSGRACTRLAAALQNRPHPARRLAEAVAAEFGRDRDG